VCSSDLDRLLDWHGQANDSQRELIGVLCRGFISIALDEDNIRDRDLDKVVLDFRNRKLVERLLADPAKLRIKWPNDLMLDGAKLSGILLEREGDAIIVGMGVNLAAAPDLPDRKTAALADYGPAPDRDIFAHSLAAAFARELERWRTYGLEPLARRWESVAHPPGTPLVVQPPGEDRIDGAFAGLTPDGALSLRLADGSTRVIHAGDVMLQNEES